MAFRKAGIKLPTKPRRVKQSKAHKQYGRMKKIQPPIDPNERKVAVCYSLPVWMVAWIEFESLKAGMHKSTFLAACVGSTRDGMIAAEEAREAMEESDEETSENDE